jgi:two-component system nitrogen regulation response regulator GlnG
MNPVWIIDDDRSIRWVFEKALTREGIGHRTFATAREALDQLASDTPEVVVSDIRMPGLSGLEFMQALKERVPSTPVIIMTPIPTSRRRGGVPGQGVRNAKLRRRPGGGAGAPHRENRRPSKLSPAPEILGQAPAMQEVFRAIGRLSQSNVTVMITGESGTGKELVARALHRHSPRGSLGSNGPFVAINTAAIPKDLLESELFGHERGAFTGAQAMRRGRFEQADGGTLFLDEIGDMPLELQTRLLRVLSDGQFYRVGGHHPMKSNVRVIAATHQDLDQRVRQGAFREDLYHRLNVIRLRLPPLRERREDIATLARFFLAKSAKDLGVDAKRISDSAIARLTQFDFPGNVRQLENICHWLTVMAPAQRVEVKDLPPEVLQGAMRDAATVAALVAAEAPEVPEAPEAQHPRAGSATAQASEAARIAATDDWLAGLEVQARQLLQAGAPDVWQALTRKVEARLIHSALELTRGRRIEAAQKLGIGRNTITRKIQELGLDG